jgi:alkylation response protein AidB-like acyl-CoA dehydrogenase
MDLARNSGKDQDPNIRQRLGWAHSNVEIIRFLGMRTLTKFLSGQHPGPDASTFKLYWLEYQLKLTELAIDILGANGLVQDGKFPSSAFATDSSSARLLPR